MSGGRPFFWSSAQLGANRYLLGEHINTPESMAERQKKDAEIPYHVRSIQRIRSGLIYSLLLVVGAALVAAILGRILLACFRPVPNGVLELLQCVGIGILLWGNASQTGLAHPNVQWNNSSGTAG